MTKASALYSLMLLLAQNSMAQRNYNIQTCSSDRRLCYEAVLKKIEMVKWENENNLIRHYKSGLSQEIKELLENYRVRVSDSANALLQDDSIWTEAFRNSNAFNQKSKEIKDIIKTGSPVSFGFWKYLNKNEVTWDHTVPTSVLVDRIIELDNAGNLSFESFSDLVEKYGFVTIITIEENDKLNENGLRQKMPDGWSFDSEADAYARYK